MTPKPDQGPLLGSLLRIANQALTEELLRWLPTSGHADIQPSHLAVLQPLWDLPEGARLTTLARDARITKPSMSALVDHLEATGYVERVEDPDDARAIRIRMTPRGRAFGRAVRAFGRGVQADWARRVGERRVEEMHTTLVLLRQSFLADSE